MTNVGIKAFAPATLSNLSSGFDLLGLALNDWGDYVHAQFSPTPGVSISSLTGHKKGVTKDATRNTACVAVTHLLKSLDYKETGISIDIQKGYPHSSGLGSSAASAVAAVVATNALLKNPYKEKRDLLPYALIGERINDPGLPADNVAASLFGGIILSSPDTLHPPMSLPVPLGISIVVFHPKIQTNTIQERKGLSPNVLLSDHIKQNEALACLILGLNSSNWDLIKLGLHDHIIEPQRKSGIPEFDLLKDKALELGALGFSISGSGPALFAFCHNSLVAENIQRDCGAIWATAGLKYSSMISTVNMEGAIVC